MSSEADKLNIMGSEIVFFADGLFVLAATTEAKANNIEDEENKKLLSNLADTFNIIGAWTQLFGDYILFKAAELEIEESLKSNQPFDIEAGRLNIMVSEAQVILDVLEVQLAERASGIAQ